MTTFVCIRSSPGASLPQAHTNTLALTETHGPLSACLPLLLCGGRTQQLPAGNATMVTKDMAVICTDMTAKSAPLPRSEMTSQIPYPVFSPYGTNVAPIDLHDVTNWSASIQDLGSA